MQKFPFNIGWWGFTFPLGAYALATCQLGIEMSSSFFKVVGTVCAATNERKIIKTGWLTKTSRYSLLCVAILWMVVSVGTLRGTVSGKLLVDPSLAEMRDRQGRKRLSAYLG